MLKKVLKNKKLVITIISIAILVLVVLLARCGSDETADTDSGSDKEVTQQEETYDGDGLKIIEDDETSENSVDTSSYWEDTQETENAIDKHGTKNDTTTSQSTEDKTGQIVENDAEGTESNDGVSEEETLEDEKSWGAIY